MRKAIAEEIRTLAARALQDAHEEQRTAERAVARSSAYLDNYLALDALARRISKADGEPFVTAE